MSAVISGNLTRSTHETFGGQRYEVDVYVDWQAILRQLGLKAVKNKRGQAQVLQGAIVVKTRKIP